MKPEKLAKALEKELEGYSGKVTAKLEKKAKQIAKETVADLKTDSPRRTGAYREGWTYAKTKGGFRVASASGKGFSLVIYNKLGNLTHLLEKSHPMPQGGMSKAQVHIKPNEEKAVKKFLSAAEEVTKDA